MNGNEPAFSKSAFYHPDGGVDGPQTGLTIRQHFAAMAMQGLCANSIPGQHQTPVRLVFEAVQIADALIAELNKTTTP